MIKLKEIFDQLNYKIYCDMDGVIADFDNRFKEYSGYSPKYFKDMWGVDEFWKIIDEGGVEFWSYMDWMPDGRELWAFIKSYKPSLLSAPSREESSREGKKIWVQREIPGTELLLSPAYEKQKYANPKSILIDDRESNIYEWKNAGGIGIFHTSAQSSIKELKKYIK